MDTEQLYKDVILFQQEIRCMDGVENFVLEIVHNGRIRLNLIVIDQKKRKNGIGTIVMNRLCDFADSHHLELSLYPNTKGSLGTTSKARLQRFYRRFGFEHVNFAMMLRKAK